MKIKEIIELDDIELNREVVVSDPSYDLSTWCLATLDNVKPGTYKGYAVVADEGEWGSRVAYLAVINEEEGDMDINDIEDPIYDMVIKSTDIGVDAGLCGIFSKDFFVQMNEDGDWFERCEDIKIADTLDAAAVVSSTGYGDGCYSLSVKYNSRGEIVALVVDYGL